MKLKGFTLIEILFSLVLLAILSLIGIASSSYFIQKNEQQIIVDELRTVLNYAKTQAVSRGNPVSLSPLDPTKNWSHGIVLTQFNKKFNKTETLYQWQWHHPHWVLEWSGISSSNAIVLSNNPINAISNGHFTLSHVPTNKSILLVLNRLGRLRHKS